MARLNLRTILMRARFHTLFPGIRLPMRQIVAIVFLCGCLRVLAADSIASDPYLWRNVVIGGGGFVTGLAAHPRVKNLIYARTDVGGAYRWDESFQRWIPITDSFEAQSTGIESLALDPNNTNR